VGLATEPRALPDEALIPTRLVLDDKAFDRVVKRLESLPVLRLARLGVDTRAKSLGKALVSEPVPMFLGIETVAAAVAS
jgi:hypothetical protein